MTSPLQMFGDDDAACVDGVCHVPQAELERLRAAPDTGEAAAAAVGATPVDRDEQ